MTTVEENAFKLNKNLKNFRNILYVFWNNYFITKQKERSGIGTEKN